MHIIYCIIYFCLYYIILCYVKLCAAKGDYIQLDNILICRNYKLAACCTDTNEYNSITCCIEGIERRTRNGLRMSQAINYAQVH